MSDDEDLSAIAYPGFVDILSAVIIMFVFFTLVVAAALFFHVMIFKSKVLSGETQIATIAKAQSTDSMSAQFADSTELEVRKPDGADNEIIIFFGQKSISVTPNVQDEILSFIQSYMTGKAYGDYYVEIHATKDPKSIENAARKIGVARMLNVRNVVISTDIESTDVSPKIVPEEGIDDSYDWIRVRILQK